MRGPSEAYLYDEAIGVRVLAGNWLVSRQTLTAGASISSANSSVTLIMQGDGNLVQYRNGVATWSTQTFVPGTRAVMQPDGNLVLYRPGNAAVWQSGTFVSGSYLLAENDGDVAIYRTTTPLWRNGSVV